MRPSLHRRRRRRFDPDHRLLRRATQCGSRGALDLNRRDRATAAPTATAFRTGSSRRARITFLPETALSLFQGLHNERRERRLPITLFAQRWRISAHRAMPAQWRPGHRYYSLAGQWRAEQARSLRGRRRECAGRSAHEVNRCNHFDGHAGVAARDVCRSRERIFASGNRARCNT